MDHEGRDQGTKESRVSGDRDVHFEEILSISPGDVHPVTWVAILFGVGVVGVVPAYSGLVWLPGVVLVIFAVAAYIAFGRRAHVRVTDTGVDIDLNWLGFNSSSGVEVSFSDIAGVEYTVPDGSYIRVKPGESTGANRYMAPRNSQGTYRDGIRIERINDDPVYVGTERPAELAETIVERTPGVESAAPFTIEGPQWG
jgi:hypothetical protein